MSNKNIRLNITADTSKAKKQIEDLKRDFGNGKLEFGKTGDKFKDSQDFSSGLNELSGVLSEINTNFKDLSATLREFIKQNTSNNKNNKRPKISDEEKSRRKELKEQEKLAKDKEKQLTKELKAKEKLAKEQQRLQEKEAKEQAKLIAQKAKEEAKKKQEQQIALDEYGNKVSKTASLIFASMNLKSYGSNAMTTAQSNNVSSMGTYGRLGIYGNDFAKGTKDAYKIGAGLGYNATDTITLQDQLLRNTGFSTKDKLDTDTVAIQRFSKAYGLDTNESMPMYSELVKRGGLGLGQAEEMSKVISTSIAKQGMEGRESEQVKAINQIFDVITSGKINVTSQDLKTSAGLLDALGKQNAALKGEKGAQLLSKGQSLFDTSDYTKLRAFGYGKNGNIGAAGVVNIQKQMNKGLSDIENLKQLKNNLPELTGGDATGPYANLLMQQLSGYNAIESDEILKFLVNNDFDSIVNKYGKATTSDQEAKLQDIQGSQTNAREVHQIRKEEALNSAGNELIAASSVPNAMYDSMPTGMRVAGDIGGNILGGAVQGIFMGKALKGIGNFSKVLKGGEAEVVSSGIKSGIFSKGLGSLKGTGVLGNLTSSGVRSSSGKLTELLPKVGKVGVALPAIIGGVQATRSFIKGDKEKGSEQLGRGLGTTGGMIAGAKLGGAIGSVAPIPVLGTAAGVLGGALVGGIGGFLGGKVGKGTYKLFSRKGSNNQEDAVTTTDGIVQYSENKKENELLAWKERLLKKEEEIFDNFLDKNKESRKAEKENPNDSKNEEPSVDKFYGDSILKKDSSSSNNVVGNVLESLTGNPAPSISSSDSSSSLDIKQIPGIDKLPKETQEELNKIINKKDPIKKKFIEEVLPGAIENYNKYGIFPSVTLGQGALESNWGKSGLTTKYNNVFGIKASKGWTGKVANMGTAEYGKNGRYNIKANFRAYDDISQSVLDHGEFLQKNSRYKNNGVFNAENSQEQIKAIARAGYATDPNYANSTYKLMESNGFVDIDKILANSSIKSYAIGTDKVDKDQLAFIHKDEAVLNKFDAKEYRQQGSSQGGTINLNFNINGAGTSQENLTETIQNAVKQALQRLGLNNGGQVNLSKSYYRYQN